MRQSIATKTSGKHCARKAAAIAVFAVLAAPSVMVSAVGAGVATPVADAAKSAADAAKGAADSQVAKVAEMAKGAEVGGVAPATEIGVPSGSYGLDKTHGYITFGYSHLGFSNPEVGFNDFDVDLVLDAEDPTSSTLTVTIDSASVDSRVAEFDKHLGGTDYFDVANHPQITFVSSAIAMTSATTADITGALTIKGISHPVTLAATLNKAGIHPLQRVPALGVSARTTIKRSQWGLSKYVPMVSDEVELRIEVELPQAP